MQSDAWRREEGVRGASEARRKERFQEPDAARQTIGVEKLDQPSTHREGHGVMHLDGMGAMAVNLSDVQMRDVSAYFAAQIPRDTGPQSAPASPKLAAQGQSIYRQGIAGSSPVPAWTARPP